MYIENPEDIIMKRKIIKIDEELCNGCGECVTECSEGAIAIVDGKAKIVKEQYCDGFGDCIGTCPIGALTVEEREAEDFNIDATKEHLENTQGKEAVWRMVEAQKRHHSHHHSPGRPGGVGCPGSRMRTMDKSGQDRNPVQIGVQQAIPSELAQWPVQLHLVPPDAPFFKEKELVFMSTCGPIASADIHWRFLRGRSIIVACPKLDETSNYIAKLAQILSESSIPKIIIVRLEVPCCGGLTAMTVEAARIAGRDDLIIEEQVILVNGIMTPPNVVQAGYEEVHNLAAF